MADRGAWLVRIVWFIAAVFMVALTWRASGHWDEQTLLQRGGTVALGCLAIATCVRFMLVTWFGAE